MKGKTVEFFPGDDKNEDVEGHRRTTPEPQTEEDVEGHRRVTPPASDAEDDVEGHVQPPRDLDVERF